MLSNLRSAINLLSVTAVVFLIAGLASAQVGKIAGTITNSETGEALVDVNILIENTTLGAASDLDGQFYIINISPGTYTVTASLVGYTTQNITGLKVFSGQTTRLEIELEPTVLEMNEITVIWEKPPVDLEETSSRAVMRQEILALSNKHLNLLLILSIRQDKR